MFPFFKNFNRILPVIFLPVFACLVFISLADTSYAAKPSKDKIPPVISELRVESVTQNSAVVMWTTDEPADSDIKYGVAPKTNINGPRDTVLVVVHAIALSELAAETIFTFCAESRDEAGNKAEGCGTFTTVAIPPPPPPPGPSSGGGGGGSVRPTLAHVSGYAYPSAVISATLRGLPFGSELKEETTAAPDGFFKISFSKFLQGLYVLSISATDANGSSSAIKRYQFDFRESDAPLIRDAVIMPPTMILSQNVLRWGDDIAVSGSAVPDTGVLINVHDVSYEVKSDSSGHYEATINTARFSPGKISVRARSSMVSGFGHDYSPSQTIVLSVSSVPKADINADGIVNIIDFSRFLAKPIDMNGDSVVNSTDVSIFLRAFGSLTP